MFGKLDFLGFSGVKKCVKNISVKMRFLNIQAEQNIFSSFFNSVADAMQFVGKNHLTVSQYQGLHVVA